MKPELSRDESDESSSVVAKRHGVENGRRGALHSMDERESQLAKLHAGIQQKRVFDEAASAEIERRLDKIVQKGLRGHYKAATVDRAPLRVKYFFGEGYTYGDQLQRKGPGQERLHPKGMVDAVPGWVRRLVVRPLVEAGMLPSEQWVNSAVINDYAPGGCIVSHVDPKHLFDRPIVSASFFSSSALCFGCRFTFRPIRTTRPVLRLPIGRGVATSISGFAADDITHCVRPDDVTRRRVAIIVRRVFPDAPRLEKPLSSLPTPPRTPVAAAAAAADRDDRRVVVQTSSPATRHALAQGRRPDPRRHHQQHQAPATGSPRRRVIKAGGVDERRLVKSESEKHERPVDARRLVKRRRHSSSDGDSSADERRSAKTRRRNARANQRKTI